MKTYKIPVSWECCGHLYIKAETLQDAIIKSYEPEQELPEGVYIDGSFKIDNEDGQMLSLEYPDEEFNILEVNSNED